MWPVLLARIKKPRKIRTRNYIACTAALNGFYQKNNCFLNYQASRYSIITRLAGVLETNAASEPVS
jgi:hypothetical protein